MPYVEYDEAGAVCAECGRQFPDEEALDAHRRASHAIEDVTRRRPPPPRKGGRSHTAP